MLQTDVLGKGEGKYTYIFCKDKHLTLLFGVGHVCNIKAAFGRFKKVNLEKEI